MFTPVVGGGIGRARTKVSGEELVAPLSLDDDDSGGVTGMLCHMAESERSYRTVGQNDSALVLHASSSSSCGLVANAKKKATKPKVAKKTILMQVPKIPKSPILPKKPKKTKK